MRCRDGIREYVGSCAACVSLRIFFWLRQKLRCAASRPSGDGKMLVIEPDGLGSMHEAQKNPDIIKMSGFFGDPPEIRTPDTLLKRQVLCRLS